MKATQVCTERSSSDDIGTSLNLVSLPGFQRLEPIRAWACFLAERVTMAELTALAQQTRDEYSPERSSPQKQDLWKQKPEEHTPARRAA